MKKVHCAQCGKELPVIRKAIPSLQRIFDLIEPHSCEGTGENIADAIQAADSSPKTTKGEVDKMFDQFTFVEKLNKGDRRSKEFLREEKGGTSQDPETTSAPPGIQQAVKSKLPSSSPEGGRDLNEPEE